MKTTYPSLKGIKNYLEKFNEAIDQLNESEDALSLNKSDKIVIKLIVHYETLYVKELLKSKIIVENNIPLNNELNTFLVSIGELEILMYLLGSDEKPFDSVIEEKLKLEYEKSEENREFEAILKKYNKYKNHYLEEQKNYF